MKLISVNEKYALEVGSPTPIASERQRMEYLSVLDMLASKESPRREEEKYAEVLMTLIEAYEEEHHSIPDASPVEVLRAIPSFSSRIFLKSSTSLRMIASRLATNASASST